MNKNLRYPLAAAILGLTWSNAAIAGVIVSPIDVTQNTLGTFDTIPANSIDFTHDGSGLPAFTSGVTDFDSYIGTNPAHALFVPGNAWASAAGVFSGIIDYDLGDLFKIDQLALWNQNQGGNQGINSFDVFTAVDATFAGAINVGSFNASDADRLAQAFDLVDSVGRYVRLQINSNHGATCCTTLGEIAFDVKDIPEPTTALALLGLGLVGVGSSRRGGRSLRKD